MALELGDGIVLNEITGTFIVDLDKCQNNVFVWDVPGHGKFAFYGYSSPKVRDDKALAEFIGDFQKNMYNGHTANKSCNVAFPFDYTDAEALVLINDSAEIFDFKDGFYDSYPKMVTSFKFTVLPTQIKADRLYWRDAKIDIASDDHNELKEHGMAVADANDSLFGVCMLIDEPNGFYAEPEPSRLTYVLEFLTAKIIDLFYNSEESIHSAFANFAAVYDFSLMRSYAPLANSPKFDEVDISNYQEINVAVNTAEQYGAFLNYSNIFDGVQKYWAMLTRNSWGLSPTDGEVTISGIYAYLDKLISNAKNACGYAGQYTGPITALMLLRDQMHQFIDEIRTRGKSSVLCLSYAPWEFQEFWLYFMLIYSSMFFHERSDSLLNDLFYVPPVRNPGLPNLDEQSLGIPLYDQIVLTSMYGKKDFEEKTNVIHDVNAALIDLVEILRNPKSGIPTMAPSGKTDYKGIAPLCEDWVNKLNDPACPPEVLIFTNIYAHNDYPTGLSSVIFSCTADPYDELQYRNSAMGREATHKTGPDGEDILIPPKYFKVHDSMPLLVYSLAFEKLYALKKAVPKDCTWWDSKAFEAYFNEVKKLRKGGQS